MPPRARESRARNALELLLGLFRLKRFDKSGRWGERVAARYLEEDGYRILVSNYRVRGGEADLICEKDGLIVAVEVKSRQSFRFGKAAEAVTRRKARRVLTAGRSYCRKHALSLSRLRGDVVTVEKVPSSDEPLVRHHPGGLGAG